MVPKLRRYSDVCILWYILMWMWPFLVPLPPALLHSRTMTERSFATRNLSRFAFSQFLACVWDLLKESIGLGSFDSKLDLRTSSVDGSIFVPKSQMSQLALPSWFYRPVLTSPVWGKVNQYSVLQAQFPLKVYHTMIRSNHQRSMCLICYVWILDSWADS